jgi:mannose-6-phosphate isomerase class I
MYSVPAGTLHAIGGGLLVLEVQEPSDTTYRVYDWGRIGPTGQGRPLHLEEACLAVRYDRAGPTRSERQGVVGPGFAMRPLPAAAELAANGLRVLVATNGPVRLMSKRGETKLEPGAVAVAEPADGTVAIAAGSCVLVSERGV